MEERKEFPINDTYRAIESVSEDLRAWESDRADQRVKAMILTKLQEARLLSLELVKPL